LTSDIHAPIAVAAKAGSNVFVEKPLCLSLAEGEELDIGLLHDSVEDLMFDQTLDLAYEAGRN